MKKSHINKKHLDIETLRSRIKSALQLDESELDRYIGEKREKVKGEFTPELYNNLTDEPFLHMIAFDEKLDLYKDNEKIETISKSALKVFEELRKRGFNPRLEYCLPIDSKYRIDIALSKHMIAIEIDGPHHNIPEQREKDSYKEKLMREYGWYVLRFSSTEAYNNPKGVVDKITEHIGK